MIWFVCVDDRFGMRFNHRRQSSDRAVIEKIIDFAEGKHLWMEPYSASLFPSSATICCDKDFLQKASSGDCCFVERICVRRYLNRAEKIVLFHWNRRYPADLYFPKKVLESDFRMVQSSDFAGFSHEQVTMEVYVR